MKNRVQTGTLEEYLDYLIPGISSGGNLPSWPPDMFGICASILQRTGAYSRALNSWPPGRRSLAGWRSDVDTLGREWRSAWNARSKKKKALPTRIRKWWEKILDAKAVRLDELAARKELVADILSLLAVADAAGLFAGLPLLKRGEYSDAFHDHSLMRLADSAGRTLCSQIHPSKLCVLPKMLTPQTGFTIRSLSHNLALYAVPEMVPRWHLGGPALPRQEFNLLLVPWPLSVNSNCFKRVQFPGHRMAPGYGYFAYRPQGGSPRAAAEYVQRLLAAAERKKIAVHGIVFPEASLTVAEYDNVRDVVRPDEDYRLLIAGICDFRSRTTSRNYARCDFLSPPGTVFSFEQFKHHRWQLEKTQLDKYGLPKVLKRDHLWWECSEIGRELHVLAIDQTLALSVLICEDLARPDPVGDLIRSIGPNLVLALLADGPQLPYRWPGRYAATLADDPGSSVLSLTSHGMVLLDKVTKRTSRRVIGLWAEQGRRPLPLKAGDKDGIVLQLIIHKENQFSADGRSDHHSKGRVRLKDRKPIVLKPQKM